MRSVCWQRTEFAAAGASLGRLPSDISARRPDSLARLCWAGVCGPRSGRSLQPGPSSSTGWVQPFLVSQPWAHTSVTQLLAPTSPTCVPTVQRQYALRKRAIYRQLVLVAVLYIQRRYRRLAQWRLRTRRQLAAAAAEECWSRHARRNAKLEEQRRAAQARDEQQRREQWKMVMAAVVSYEMDRQAAREVAAAAVAAERRCLREVEARKLLRRHLIAHCLRRRIRLRVESKRHAAIDEMRSLLIAIHGAVDVGLSVAGVDGVPAAATFGGGGGDRTSRSRQVQQQHQRQAPRRGKLIKTTLATKADRRRRRQRKGELSAPTAPTARSAAPLAGYLLQRRTPQKLAPLVSQHGCQFDKPTM
jgi:hypothetical protein